MTPFPPDRSGRARIDEQRRTAVFLMIVFDTSGLAVDIVWVVKNRRILKKRVLQINYFIRLAHAKNRVSVYVGS